MTDPKPRVQLAHPPLAQHLLEGGLTRVCDELARFMLSFRDPDGFRLPDFDEQATVRPIAGGQAPVRHSREEAATFADWSCENCGGAGWHPSQDPSYAGWCWCRWCAVKNRDASRVTHPPASEPLTTMPRDYGHGLAEPKPSLAIQLSRACSELEESRASDLRHTRERDDARAELESLGVYTARKLAEAQARVETEYDRGRREGREDVDKYANAVGLIDGALGLAGARPLAETVAAVESKLARIRQLEGELSKAWEATGVASTVRGLTTLEDVIRVQLEQRDEAQAELTRVKADNERLREDDAAQRKLAAVLGMVNVPDTGPEWPASWDALIGQVKSMVGYEKALSEAQSKIFALEAETMTLTSERDAARMGQEEWRVGHDNEQAAHRLTLAERDQERAAHEVTRRERAQLQANVLSLLKPRFPLYCAYCGMGAPTDHQAEHHHQWAEWRKALPALDRTEGEQTAKEWYHPSPEVEQPATPPELPDTSAEAPKVPTWCECDNVYPPCPSGACPTTKARFAKAEAPREIKLHSTWRRKSDGEAGKVWRVYPDGGRVGWADSRGYGNTYEVAVFRERFEWVSDPELLTREVGSDSGSGSDSGT